MPSQDFKLPRISARTRLRINKPRSAHLAKLCVNIGAAIDLLSEKHPYSHKIPARQRNDVSRHLQAAIAAVFRDSIHTARNCLAVASDILVATQNKTLPLKKPVGVNARTLGNINYRNRRTGEDLWDTIQIPIKGQRNLYYKADDPIIALTIIMPKKPVQRYISKVLRKIFEAAYVLSPRFLLTERLEEQLQRFDILHNAYNDLHSTWLSKKIPQDLLNQLDPIYGFSTSTTIINAGGILIPALTFNLYLARQELNNGNYTAVTTRLDNIERALKTLQTIIEYVVNANNEQEQAVHTAIKENDIWDIILKCSHGTLRDQFEDSLDDWGGAKKYVVLAMCGGPALLTIYVSAGAMLIFSIESFVACFFCHMVYGITADPSDCAWGIAEDVVVCLFNGGNE